MEDSKDLSIVNGRRAANRAAMPIVAGFIDELRAQGQTPKVIYASENGVEVGKRPHGECVFTIPANYRKPVQVAKKECR